MLEAKPIIKDKLWVVKKGKNQVATIQSIHGSSNVVLVVEGARKKYPSVNVLKKNHNIVFDSKVQEPAEPKFNVCGYPTDARPYAGIYDVEQGYPIYTKSETSKSYYCAGYYLVQYKNKWIKEFCPKLLTLDRNPNKGPFDSMTQCKAVQKLI